MPAGLQISLQVSEILDDPVVHHRDATVAVEMRVRIDQAGPAVRRPARMSDTHATVGHGPLQTGDQTVRGQPHQETDRQNPEQPGDKAPIALRTGDTLHAEPEIVVRPQK